MPDNEKKAIKIGKGSCRWALYFLGSDRVGAAGAQQKSQGARRLAGWSCQLAGRRRSPPALASTEAIPPIGLHTANASAMADAAAVGGGLPSSQSVVTGDARRFRLRAPSYPLETLADRGLRRATKSDGRTDS